MSKIISKKNKKKLAWKSFSETEYQQTAMKMVHFSAKTVNSNTLPFGIRLGIDVNLNLPYVAASSIDRKNVPMDYTKNIGVPSKMVKQINAVLHKTIDRFENVPQADIDAIFKCIETLNSSYESADSVGIRLRQIILQNADGNDVVATPLPCAGLSALINQRIEEELDSENPINNKHLKEKKIIRRKRAYLGVGGSNPQNVGVNVRAMQRPLMFKVPMMNEHSREIRQALSIHYKGLSIKPNLMILKDFIKWQDKLLARHFDITPSNLEIRNKETEFLVAITNNFMKQAEAAEKLLRNNIEKLPDNKTCSSDLPFLQQALLDRSLRTMEWKRKFADELHSKIISQLVWIDTEKKGLKATKSETTSWISIIEGAV